MSALDNVHVVSETMAVTLKSNLFNVMGRIQTHHLFERQILAFF